MIAIMHKHEGLGLAAPQIGINERIIIVEVDEACHVMLNPEIKWHSQDKVLGYEGCLSVPDVECSVRRYGTLVVAYDDLSGARCQMPASGLLARVIQHEIDHLNGILITDRATESK